MPRIAPIDNDDLAERYLSGLNPHQLAAHYGVCHQTIYNRLVKLGIKEDRRTKFEDNGDERKCCKCGIWRHKNEYNISRRPGKLRTHCKTCATATSRANYEKRREHYDRVHLAYYYRKKASPTIEDIRLFLWQGVRKRNLERHGTAVSFTRVEFDAWLDQNGLEEKFAAFVVSGIDRWKKPSVDRLDNSKGYEFSNMRLVTWLENHTAWITSKELSAQCLRNLHPEKFEVFTRGQNR